MQTLSELIARLQDLQQLRGPDTPVVVKSNGSELQIDGIRSDTSTGNSIVIINVIS